MNKVEKIKEVIQKLKSLDLDNSDENEIKQLLLQFERFGFIGLDLAPTNEFIRARPLKIADSVTNINDLSFKPQAFNTTYQRCSTPNQTILYSVLVQPDFRPQGFPALARATGLLEVVPEMRDKTSKGIWKVAYGKWTNTRPMRLAAICFSNQFVNKNPQTELLYNAYHENLKAMPELKEVSLLITDFLAHEFSKDSITNHKQYLISSVFTEICLERGFDGVMYPSVRMAGEGLNIAIRTDFVEKYLELRTAGECTFYKNGEQTIGLNNTVTTIPRGQKELKLKPISDQKSYDQEEYRVKKQLGLI